MTRRSIGAHQGLAAARWALAVATAAMLMTGCAAPPTSDPSVSASTSRVTATGPVILAGDVTVVRLGQALTAEFGNLPMSSQRPGADVDHSRGLALDVVVPGWETEAGVARGDAITAWVQSHAAHYRVRYTLWRQQYQAVGQRPVPMADRGSPTANNRDHVHITIAAPSVATSHSRTQP